MNAVFLAAPGPYRRALRPILCGLRALVSIGASSATAQTGGVLEQQLDSIAGARVRENRAVGIVAAVVKGNDERGSRVRLTASQRARCRGSRPGRFAGAFRY